MDYFEENILNLFTYHEKLKFNEIEKSLKIRSNKLNYYLKKLIQKEIIERHKEFYKLTEKKEYLIPYISNKNPVLTIILIYIGNKKQVFLIKRQKRPYENKLALPGGRLLLGETISKATTRIMKEKWNIMAKLSKINSVSLEHLIKNKEVIHTFLLVFVSAKTKEKINLTEINKNKKKIISSDYILITKDINKNIDVKTIRSIKKEY